MNSQKPIRQNAALEKLPQLALDEPRNHAIAPALPRQEVLEVSSDHIIIENALGRVARCVTCAGFAYGQSIIQRPAAANLGNACNISAQHGSRGSPLCLGASMDLTARVEIELTFLGWLRNVSKKCLTSSLARPNAAVATVLTKGQ